MRTFGRFLGRVLLALIVLGVGIWFLAPREEVSVVVTFDEASIGDDVDTYLASRELRFDDLTEGVQKRVVWHDVVGEMTPLSIVYVHGFSATSEEIRPVPDRVAERLGANLVYTRLQGHGRPGAALAEATAQGWMNDFAEAVAIGRRVGERVVVIATSTGGTLAAEAALQDALMEDVAGIIFVSPNFAIADPAAAVLTLPGARYWVPRVAGETRSWEPSNEGHATYWTSSYPTEALFQMAALVEHAREQDYSAAKVAGLFWFSDADGVVDHKATRRVAEAWGGPKEVTAITVEAGDDPYAHVIAGDIMSPGMNDSAVQYFVSWINDL